MSPKNKPKEQPSQDPAFLEDNKAVYSCLETVMHWYLSVVEEEHFAFLLVTDGPDGQKTTYYPSTGDYEASERKIRRDLEAAKAKIDRYVFVYTGHWETPRGRTVNGALVTMESRVFGPHVAGFETKKGKTGVLEVKGDIHIISQADWELFPLDNRLK